MSGRAHRYGSGAGKESVFWTFQRSIGFDHRLARYQLAIDRAWCTELRACGVLTSTESSRLRAALARLSHDLPSLRWTGDDEDVHGWLERLLTKRIGPLGGKVHTARSRNDLVAACLRRYVMDQSKTLADACGALALAFTRRARSETKTLLPAYTHLQRGQPTTLAHHLCAYAEMFLRDRDRLRASRAEADASPLGCGAATGTPYPIDRRRAARACGFSRVCGNSLDAVSDRDFALSFLGACATAGTHLSRLGEEWVLWASSEFGYLAIPPTLSTGSSIMPNKRNPDAPELLRAKSARLASAHARLLGVLKGLPFAYNKDLQEDKEPVFDAAETLSPALEVARRLVEGARFDRGRMREAVEGSAGQILATELADRLVALGLSFRDAHGRVSALCDRLTNEGRSVRDLTDAECRALHPRLSARDARALTPLAAVERRRSEGGCSPIAVLARLANLTRGLSR
ncbi:MAG: argininosuccinate lyase [Planctomycetes bacterium]|nr:argininosuccinate lyase [Planctomycetota bacterium]